MLGSKHERVIGDTITDERRAQALEQLKMSRRRLVQGVCQNVFLGFVGGGATNLGAVNALTEISSENVSKKDLAIDASTIVLGIASIAIALRQGIKDLGKNTEAYRKAANYLDKVNNPLP